MFFEKGKAYRHVGTGTELKMLEEIETSIYGKCLLAEDLHGDFHPCGQHEENAMNYIEISIEEYNKNLDNNRKED